MERVNVQYHLQADPQAPLILGNSKALEQVFDNLINNAVQAMSDKGGRLALKVQYHKAPENQETDASGRETLPNRKSYLEISVADTGPGIPKEMQDRVFQPFFTTKSNGTGLGLAISKRIITAHKGTLSLTSFPGGTVFHVQLPISEA
jgi:signal transduction histidine kinase